ncbi:MAG: hypothetical protein KJO07_08250 [Deltaproteobacteria bacterium]|nr:hypothetical protein [Deltaproteobacteria bacterium]
MRRVALIVTVLAIASCSGGERLYSGPATAPEELEVGVGEFAAFAVSIPEGSRAPLEVSSMVASCTPAEVCAAAVLEKRVLVFGKAAGKGLVKVEFTHPVTGYPREREVVVGIRPTTAVPSLAVGATVDPALGTRLQVEIDGQAYRCFGLGPGSPGSLSLACAAPASDGGASYAFGGRNQPDGLTDTVRMCAEPDTGAIRSISIYEPVNRVLGEPGRVCPRPTAE